MGDPGLVPVSCSDSDLVPLWPSLIFSLGIHSLEATPPPHPDVGGGDVGFFFLFFF